MSRTHDEIETPPHKHHGVEELEDINILKPTPSHFEKLYLQPEQAVAGNLRLTFGNPTPMYALVVNSLG